MDIMDTVRLPLHPARFPDWEAEDLLVGRLADDLVPLTDDQARALLDEMVFQLPKDVLHTELVGYNLKRPTPLALDLPAGGPRLQYYLVELALNTLIPSPASLTRLRLKLDLRGGDHPASPVVAYDLFPLTQIDQKTTSIGELSLDVSKALTFVVPGPVGVALADCLGLKLTIPLRWTSQYARIRTSGRMSNPVEWLVTDPATADNFTTYVIIRAPESDTVEVDATVAGELRNEGVLGRIQATRFESDRHTYILNGDGT